MSHATLLLTLALVAGGALAGCIDATDALEPADAAAALASIVALDAPHEVVADGAGVVWQGRELSAPEAGEADQFQGFFLGHGPLPCDDEARCDRVPFALSEPADRMVVSIQWDSRDDTYETVGGYLGAPRLFMDLRVLDATGALVADGAESGHYASVATLEPAAAGNYTIEIVAVYGTGAYAGAVHAPREPPAPADPARELLPDVIMLPPTQLRVEHPLAREAAPAMLAAGVRGCGPDEAGEGGMRRCLRFAGHVGNVGEGTFEMRLSHDEAAASIPGEGKWAQRVYAADGSFRDELVAEAEYHFVHGHFHLLRMAETTVYAFDEATGTRGEAVGDGRKTGFCFIDGGLADLAAPGAVPPEYFGAGCCYYVAFCQLDMAFYDEFFMGISPGWYDTYPWWRADQYVDIAGVPDGVYELVTVADPDGVLFERDRTNNEASVVFRLTGDEVEVLGPPAA